MNSYLKLFLLLFTCLTHVFGTDTFIVESLTQEFSSLHELQGEWENSDGQRLLVKEDAVFFPEDDDGVILRQVGTENNFRVHFLDWICHIYTPSLIVWKNMKNMKEEVTWQRPKPKKFADLQGEWIISEAERVQIFGDVLMTTNSEMKKYALHKLTKLEDDKIILKIGEHVWNLEKNSSNLYALKKGEQEVIWKRKVKLWEPLEGDWIDSTKNQFSINVNGDVVKITDYVTKNLYEYELTPDDQQYLLEVSENKIVWKYDKNQDEVKWIRPQVSLYDLKGYWINSEGQRLTVKEYQNKDDIDTYILVEFLNTDINFKVKDTDSQIILNEEWVLEKNNTKFIVWKREQEGKIQAIKWYRPQRINQLSNFQQNLGQQQHAYVGRSSQNLYYNQQTNPYIHPKYYYNAASEDQIKMHLQTPNPNIYHQVYNQVVNSRQNTQPQYMNYNPQIQPTNSHLSNTLNQPNNIQPILTSSQNLNYIQQKRSYTIADFPLGKYKVLFDNPATQTIALGSEPLVTYKPGDIVEIVEIRENESGTRIRGKVNLGLWISLANNENGHVWVQIHYQDGQPVPYQDGQTVYQPNLLNTNSKSNIKGSMIYDIDSKKNVQHESKTESNLEKRKRIDKNNVKTSFSNSEGKSSKKDGNSTTGLSQTMEYTGISDSDTKVKTTKKESKKNKGKPKATAKKSENTYDNLLLPANKNSKNTNKKSKDVNKLNDI